MWNSTTKLLFLIDSFIRTRNSTLSCVVWKGVRENKTEISAEYENIIKDEIDANVSYFCVQLVYHPYDLNCEKYYVIVSSGNAENFFYYKIMRNDIKTTVILYSLH